MRQLALNAASGPESRLAVGREVDPRIPVAVALAVLQRVRHEDRANRRGPPTCMEPPWS
jgi:hypothetical protein